MKRILVVEDNPEYIDAASVYFRTYAGLQVAHGHDYNVALARLYEETDLDGAIIDCFFPNVTGSQDIKPGREAVAKMVAADPTETRVRAVLDEFGKYVELDDELGPLVRAFAYTQIDSDQEPSQSNMLLAVKQVNQTTNKAATTIIAKKTFKAAYGKQASRYKDYYSALEKAMEEDEANQPLGILVGEKAEELEMPFILATSTYHHDILTQPVHNYIIGRGWGFVDCGSGQEDKKATIEFWERAFNALQERAKWATT